MSSEATPPNVVIHCWSGPRCVSTSLMYSFAQRGDTEVVDEPLYAHFLKLNPGLERPYHDLVMQAQDSDGNQVLSNLLSTSSFSQNKPILYLKHMAKQRQGLDKRLLHQRNSRHFLLVRHPLKVIQSFGEVVEPTLSETCYPALLELYSELRSMGKAPPVVLSDDLVKAAEATLRVLCAELEIPFDPGMLTWAEGPKEYDGVWAPWWYRRTHSSTGFEPPSTTKPTTTSLQRSTSTSTVQPAALSEPLKHLLDECRPLWTALKARALHIPTATTSNQFSSLQNNNHPPVDNTILNTTTTSRTTATTMAQENSEKVVQKGTHSYVSDPRNADILVGMRDGVSGDYDLVWRPEAKVSVLDSGFMLGDGVWEGIRVHGGVVVFAKEHFERLYEGAKAIDMDLGVSMDELQDMVYQCIDANGMTDGVHIRLMVTRGLKPTPYQQPRITIGLPTIVILPEYKQATQASTSLGLTLFTVHIRRGAPDVQDPGWNSHSKLNCIAACIQANKAGADEALMLDPQGFVATCNSTNFFIVRKGEVWAPTTKYQLQGITRGMVLELCNTNKIPCRECDFSLTQVYSAEEAFVTGTFAGQIHVKEVDGRVIGDGKKGPVVERLQRLYAALCDEQAQQGRIAL